MKNTRRNDKPGIAVAVAAITTIGTIIVATIQSGILTNAAAPAAAITATLPPAQSPAISGISYTIPEPKPLPNNVRDHVGSVKVEYGCAILYGSPKDDTDQLRICENTPAMGAPWNTRARRMSVDCSTASKDGIIVLVWSEPNYAGHRWEYSFGC